MKRYYRPRPFRGLLDREMHKLWIEMDNNRSPEQHIPVRYKLLERRYRLLRNRFRHYHPHR